MNWRATYILTARRDLAVVPHSTIAKSKDRQCQLAERSSWHDRNG
jgi:hypothetical protein